MRSHYVPIKMNKHIYINLYIHKQRIPSADGDAEQLKHCFCDENPKWQNQSVAASYKVEHTRETHLLNNPAILLLGCHPTEMKTYVHTVTCTWKLRVPSFKTNKTKKKLKCPSLSEWIHNLWCKEREQSMDVCHATVDLKSIIPCERSTN